MTAPGRRLLLAVLLGLAPLLALGLWQAQEASRSIRLSAEMHSADLAAQEVGRLTGRIEQARGVLALMARTALDEGWGPQGCGALPGRAALALPAGSVLAFRTAEGALVCQTRPGAAPRLARHPAGRTALADPAGLSLAAPVPGEPQGDAVLLLLPPAALMPAQAPGSMWLADAQGGRLWPAAAATPGPEGGAPRLWPLVPGVLALSVRPPPAGGLAFWGLVLPLLGAALGGAVLWLVIARGLLDPLSAAALRLGRLVGRPPPAPEGFATALDDIAEARASDHARLAEATRHETVLLKEVHHRVKNNLQMIVSMLNMQLRQSLAPETAQLLFRTRDRVLGLSSVHQHLYRGGNLSMVRADLLLDEIAGRMLARTDPLVGAEVSVRLEPAELSPDQAVPLAMLTSEALANALTALAAPRVGERACLRLSLTRAQPGLLELTLTNSCRPDEGDAPDTAASRGLGSRLIRAFADQLSGRLTIARSAESYRLVLVFPADPSQIPAEDAEGPPADAPPA